ncbi:MAG: site-2 protease family protein [Clostridiales bacterium]|nr:site-2 protease family protein [Clostridiales bacterium]
MTFFAAAFAAALFGHGWEFLTLVGVVSAHEVAHVAVAAVFGAVPSGVTLTCAGETVIIPGVEDLSAAERLVVFAAGPVFNLALFAAASTLGDGWGMFRFFNILVAGFNLLPAYPMDGGRILGVIAEMFVDADAARRITAAVSRAVSCGVIAVGIAAFSFFPYNLLVVVLGLNMRRIGAANKPR